MKSMVLFFFSRKKLFCFFFSLHDDDDKAPFEIYRHVSVDEKLKKNEIYFLTIFLSSVKMKSIIITFIIIIITLVVDTRWHKKLKKDILNSPKSIKDKTNM